MKPQERSGFVDVYILLKQHTDGKFFVDTTSARDLGNGMFSTLQEAQHQQTMEKLKGHPCEVYHLEWPLK